ncbi:MAG: hypothetical protein LBE55_02990 [Clostridiales bacterium]|nr:hypothetical protein [Clostridiales bacterium]
MNMLGKLGANPQSFWYKTAAARNTAWPAADKDCDEESMAQALRAAIDEYTDKMLRGLGALTEDEIEAKVAEFEAIHAPHNETPENMANFAAKVRDFRAALARLAEIEHSEMLIKPAKAAEEEQDSIAGFVRLQITKNAPRQI